MFAIKLLLTVVATLFNAWYCFAKIKARFGFSAVDKFILAWTNGTSEISVYSVGSTLNSHYMTLASAVFGVFIAEINRLVARGKNRELSDLFVKTSRIFALLVMLIMLPVTASLSMGLGQDIVRAKNVHRTQILINIAVTFCNFLVSIPIACGLAAETGEPVVLTCTDRSDSLTELYSCSD